MRKSFLIIKKDIEYTKELALRMQRPGWDLQGRFCC